MILSDKTIEKLLAEGSLAIEPLEPEQIQPASVDIRLGDTFGIVEDTPSGIVGNPASPFVRNFILGQLKVRQENLSSLFERRDA